MRQHADAAADHLEQKQWGDSEAPQDETRTIRRNNKDLVFDCGPFLLSELRTTVKRMKKDKASGPDEEPMIFSSGWTRTI